MTAQQAVAQLQTLQEQYQHYVQQNLKLDMSRGKPGNDVVDLASGIFDTVSPQTGYLAADGTDVRNYGLLEGLPEARALFGQLLGVPAQQVLVGGNSSLALMFDYVAMAMSHGVLGQQPWQAGRSKIIFPVPAYDRHMAIADYFGLQAIAVPMTAEGPDMDLVEQLVANDADICAIWCVPKYSNPDGITYSDQTVRRLAAMPTAAKEFRILWDNAYFVHDLYPTGDQLLDLLEQTTACGNPDRAVMFCSTSKISLPGAGVAALAASPANIAQIRGRWALATIGYDKINQLRHVRYYRDAQGVYDHMQRIAQVLRPKFELVLDIFNQQLAGQGIAQWHTPRGGYFISVHVMPGCAKRVVALMKQAGVVMTPAGATWPHGVDPQDSNIRVAPTFPKIEELRVAAQLFCLCVQIAALEKLAGQA